MSIWKIKCRFEKINVDLKKQMLIWKNKCWFGKINIDLKKLMFIWKNKCRFEKINVDLKKLMFIWKNKCWFGKINVDLIKYIKVVITWSRLAGMKFQLVQTRQISLYDYTWKLNFVLAGRDSFPLGIWLDLHLFYLDFSL